jgi:putative molybdopterin biosynthesis protein
MKQRQFLHVLSKADAEQRFRAALAPDGVLPDLGSEPVDLDAALGRVLAEDVASAIDVPSFDRANLDGWAVRAGDTFGASEREPKRLLIAAEPVSMGRLPARPLGAGEAMAIPTGGALPRGADAVLQLEWTEIDGVEVIVTKALVPGTAITHAGTDIARGDVVQRAGEAITAREIGALAAIGCAHVRVRRRPKVAIVSTGDELVSVGASLQPGQIVDSNGAILAAAVREHGGEPISLGVVPDDEVALAGALRRALLHDVVVVSGGTSKGPGDLVARVLGHVLAPPGIVVHGVALKPGKPLCLAVSERTPVVVLPGFPTSAMFTFQDFVAPLLRELARLPPPSHLAGETRARLAHRVGSDPGRTEYVLAHLVEGDQGTIAYPIGKGSGSVSAWCQADGYFVVPQLVERLDAGAEVMVRAMAGSAPRRVDLTVIGSHCSGLDIIIGELTRRGLTVKTIAVGSEAGLAAAMRGACDIAPIHLFDPRTSDYNGPFLRDGVELIAGYGRLQGLVYRAGDARFDEATEVEQTVRAAVASGAAMINRNAGSGTRILIDRLLRDLRPEGYRIEASSHHAVVAAIEQGRADFGVAIAPVVRGRPLGFAALTTERFDFAVPSSRRKRPAVRAFEQLLGEAPLRQLLRDAGFSLPEPDGA